MQRSRKIPVRDLVTASKFILRCLALKAVTNAVAAEGVVIAHMSSMYRRYNNVSELLDRRGSSIVARKIVAYDTATGVPMAVPLICKYMLS
jgi:hypothetical protein